LSRPADRPPSWLWPAAWAVLIGLGAVLRLLYLNLPLRYDEAATFFAARVDSPLALLAGYTPNNHLLHTLLVRLSIGLFGPAEWAVRLPALLAGLALIPSVGFIFGRVFGREEGFLGAALTAASGWLVFYSVNGRGYQLTALLAPWAFYAAWQSFQSRRPVWDLAAGLLAGAAVATVPSLLWVAAGLTLALAAVPGPPGVRLGRLIRFGLAAGVAATVLYLPMLLQRGLAPLVDNPHVAPVGLAAAAKSLVFQVVEVAGLIWPTMGLGWLSLALILAAGATLLWRRPSPAEWFVLLMLPWPFLCELVQRVRAPGRSFLFLAPLVYLLWLRARPRRWDACLDGWRLAGWGTALTLGLGLALAAGGGVPSSQDTGPSPSARPAAAFLAGPAGLRAGDKVIADVPDDAPLAYYLFRAGLDDRAILPRGRLSPGRMFVLETRANPLSLLARRWPGLEERRSRQAAAWPGAELWLVEPAGESD